ncbi:hypothetical protein [Flavobacterium sp.]|uniref:hypothetical protein n=1 Tax=Flavobacterium sp. TaxID=239 RepID=UPI00286DC8BE|nr:hypothetical protein [Flavobacterium sp.]
MKHYLLLLFLSLFCSFAVYSQSSEKLILLKDVDTNLPIEDATVFIVKTKQTLLSNSEGKITFILTGSSNIQVSHSSYKSVVVRSNTLAKTDNVIYLKNNVSDLDEIIITKQHPQIILKSLIENSIKKLTVPARLKVYSREFFKTDGNCTSFNDGLINFQLFIKNKNFNNIILVEQNRSYGLPNDRFSPDVLGYNLNNIMENYYNFKYLIPILNSDSKKKYDYIIKGYSANGDFNVMLVSPVENSDELRDNYKIIYDYKKKIILEVSSSLSPSILINVKQKTSIGSKNIYKSSYKNIYRFDNSNYYLVASKEEIGFERIEKNKSIDVEISNYLVTTNFSTNNFTYNDSNVFKNQTLFNKKNTILSPYWYISGLTTTEEEQEIVSKLELKVD